MGALEDGPLIAPVMVNGHGPYLFVLNPHSKSLIDPRVARTCDLYVFRTALGITDESDRVVEEKIDVAEVPTVTLGDLTVRRRTFFVLPSELKFHGLPVAGVIGGDFLAETLIWTIDRDRQMVHLATQGNQSPPGSALRIKADRIEDSHFFINVRLNGKKTAYLYADIASTASALWPEIAAKAALEPMRGRVAEDFFGRKFNYPNGWNAGTVSVGDVDSTNLVFYEYADRRVRKRDMDGRLARDFFSRFHVTVNWHKESIWLWPRDADINDHLSDRLRRWGESLEDCETPACVSIEHDPENLQISWSRPSTRTASECRCKGCSWRSQRARPKSSSRVAPRCRTLLPTDFASST
jgi:hypothetical protein